MGLWREIGRECQQGKQHDVPEPMHFHVAISESVKVGSSQQDIITAAGRQNGARGHRRRARGPRREAARSSWSALLPLRGRSGAAP